MNDYEEEYEFDQPTEPGWYPAEPMAWKKMIAFFFLVVLAFAIPPLFIVAIVWFFIESMRKRD